MSGDSIEVQLARFDEQLKMIIAEFQESKRSRGVQHKRIDDLILDVSGIRIDLNEVKRKLDSAQPTIEEFITIKHKIVGAGQLGRWLWIVGAFLLGAAATSREALLHWLSGAK